MKPSRLETLVEDEMHREESCCEEFTHSEKLSLESSSEFDDLDDYAKEE